jgi:NADH-quinone oxidoreductase subunit K
MYDKLLNVGLEHYLITSAIIFIIGICGILINRKNVITILMSIELMLLSVNINMVAFSNYFKELSGQVFSMFILTVAAAEAAIGLAILVTYYRNKNSIEVEDINQMRG